MDGWSFFASGLSAECINGPIEWILYRWGKPKPMPSLTLNAPDPEFEIGLELDSAEVRGILLYNNQEWGRSVLSSMLLNQAEHCIQSHFRFLKLTLLAVRLTMNCYIVYRLSWLSTKARVNFEWYYYRTGTIRWRATSLWNACELPFPSLSVLYLECDLGSIRPLSSRHQLGITRSFRFLPVPGSEGFLFGWTRSAY